MSLPMLNYWELPVDDRERIAAPQKKIALVLHKSKHNINPCQQILFEVTSGENI